MYNYYLVIKIEIFYLLFLFELCFQEITFHQNINISTCGYFYIFPIKHPNP